MIRSDPLFIIYRGGVIRSVLPLVTRRGRSIIAVLAVYVRPFARQATAFHGIPAVDLGKMVVGNCWRSEIPAEVIEQLVFGQVVQMPEAHHNIAREIVLGTGMNVHTDAYSVSRAHQFSGGCKRRRKPDGRNYSRGDCRWGRFLFRIASWRQ